MRKLLILITILSFSLLLAGCPLADNRDESDPEITDEPVVSSEEVNDEINGPLGDLVKMHQLDFTYNIDVKTTEKYPDRNSGFEAELQVLIDKNSFTFTGGKITLNIRSLDHLFRLTQDQYMFLWLLPEDLIETEPGQYNLNPDQKMNYIKRTLEPCQSIEGCDYDQFVLDFEESLESVIVSSLDDKISEIKIFFTYPNNDTKEYHYTFEY